MARTCEWEKVSAGNYRAELNGHTMEFKRIPHSTHYSVFVDDLKIADAGNTNSAKAKAIKYVERINMGKTTPTIVSPETVAEALEAAKEPFEADILPSPPADIQIPMMPVAEVPTFHVSLSFHYVGETKEPNKLTEEIKKHVDAIRALGGEIEAEMSITSNTTIKL